MFRFPFRWVAGLGRKLPPTATEPEAGLFVPYDPMPDDIADAIGYPGKRHRDPRRFRFELALFLQEEILLREKYDLLLTRLLDAERR